MLVTARAGERLVLFPSGRFARGLCLLCSAGKTDQKKKRPCLKLVEIAREAARPTLTQSKLNYHVSLDECVSTLELIKGVKYRAMTSRRFK